MKDCTVILLYTFFNKHLVNKISKDEIIEIIKDAVNIEKEFVTDALPVSLLGMNALQMQSYIEFVADRLLVEFNCPKQYNAINPFDFMEKISVDTKTNFFEGRVGEYAKPGVASGKSSRTFSKDADF